MANFVQQTLSDEGYLVARSINTGEEHIIPLSVAIPWTTNESTPAEVAAARDQNILRDAKMAQLGKRIMKLDSNMKKGFATMYDQCSEAVKLYLETVDNWDRIDCDQSVQDLMKAIQKICVGHGETNQDMYNIVQGCKNMFLFRQDDGMSTEDYVRDFKSYWDTHEAYKADPAFHPKLAKARLDDIAADADHPTADERSKAELEIKEEIMAGLVISSANQKPLGY